MGEQTTVHIISHTHWDREWFLNSPFTNEWLLDFFDSLFSMLEKEPEYRFVLDGQTLIIEDYLEQLRIKGRNVESYREKIEAFVRESRLLIGPYYLQPDWNLVSGESLIRNLLIGNRIASSFGNCMNVGWLLDNFGQISQAVQIHKGFGLLGLYVWRGIEMDPQNVSLEFMWESPDGSGLLAVYLLDSYRNAMQLSRYPSIARERIVHEIEKLKLFATTDNILLMNGYDQETVPDDLMPILRELEIPCCILKQSDPEVYIDAVREDNPKLQTIRGQLYSGRYISVFPGTLSARMYLKVLNATVENLMEKKLEPLVALAWALGFKNDYDLVALWKELLKNHPHDSICGVSVDDVHSDMEKRFATTSREAKRIIARVLDMVVSLIDTSSVKHLGEKSFASNEKAEVYVIFNLSPIGSKGPVEIKPDSFPRGVMDANGRVLQIQKTFEGALLVELESIPPMGYSTIYLRAQGEGEGERPIQGDLKENRGIENEYYTVEFAEDGSLTVYDKIRGDVYPGLGVYEDGADAGDTYNYSPCEFDTIYTSSSCKTSVEVVERGELRSVARIKHQLKLPVALREDRKGRSESFAILPVTTYVFLEKGSPLIRFRTLVKNTVRDHRLRVLFPTGIETKRSFASSQFDVVEHPIEPTPYDDSKIPPELKRLLLGAREPLPGRIFPNDSFVDISDGRRGIAVLTGGLPEYEVVGDSNAVALTLFRSVGWLARGDLLTRIGDAGPAILTPEAQCLRTMEFEYALYIHNGDWVEGEVQRYADYFNQGKLVVKTDFHRGNLSGSEGFIEVIGESGTFSFSILKIAEDGRALIFRFYNPDVSSARLRIRMKFDIVEAFYTDLLERVTGAVERENRNCIVVVIGAKKIVTVKVIVKRWRLSSENAKGVVSLCENKSVHEDFSGYDSLPVITKEEIKGEADRIDMISREKREIENRIANLKKRYSKSDSKSLKTEKELELLNGTLATLERELLEAELSLLLSKKKYIELNPEDTTYGLSMKDIEERLRELGYKLNFARVKKRTYDYISEYYRAL